MPEGQTDYGRDISAARAEQCGSQGDRDTGREGEREREEES